MLQTMRLSVKVGDLVELSAIGRGTVYLHKFKGKVGVVVEARTKEA